MVLSKIYSQQVYQIIYLQFLNEKAVAEGVAAIHNETASILKYNDENSLACTILMAYYSAKAYYMNPVMELPSGKGFADVVYLPRRNVDCPALVVELKWNKSAKGAIAQIKEREYASWICGYTGDILLVGINYNEKKGHDCVIEKYVKVEKRKVGKSMLFVEYPKCSTCKKAKKWLDERGADYVSRHIKEENPTAEELKEWHEKSRLPLKRFFNTSGTLYRELGLKDKLADMDEEEQYALLATDGMLVKRPLLVGENFVLAGFKEKEWEAVL